MNARIILGLCTLFLIFLTIPTYAAELELTADEQAFLSDMKVTGIPMLFQTPEAMSIGVFYGRDTAISDIAAKKTENLDAFTEKISTYTLGQQTGSLRESWLSAAKVLKTDLEEYGTLIPGCGSCVSTMNEMYPKLLESASGVYEDMISFYQENQVSS